MEEVSCSSQQESEDTPQLSQLQVTVSASTSEDAPSRAGRKRKYRSTIWDYFLKDNKSAKCIKCGLSYSHSEKTSNLIKVDS